MSANPSRSSSTTFPLLADPPTGNTSDDPSEWVEVLTESACMNLLTTVAVGRVALTRHALPVVLPVNFGLDGRGIVIRTSAGSLLAAANDDVVVAFEADQLDPQTCTGWSVLVTGTMREVTETSALLRAQQMRLAPWVGGARHHYVRITPGLVSGRRIRPPLSAPPHDIPGGTE